VNKFLRGHFGNRSFLQAILILVGGTTAGHLVTALTLPIATRIYSPADFSVLSVFSAIVSVVSVAACLRFDTAITVTTTEEDARAALVLAFLFAFLISGVFSLLLSIMPRTLFERLGYESLVAYLWALPIAVLAASAFAALQSWYIRKAQFWPIAQSRVLQSISASATQLLSGAVWFGPLGLLLGYVANNMVGCILLGRRFAREEHLKNIDYNRLIQVARTYDKFPKYSTFEALLNIGAIQIPVLLIAVFAVGPEAGYLLLAMSVMQVPMALIGNAVGQVYLARGPQEYRSGRLPELTADTLRRLSVAGVGPLLFAGLVSPHVFQFVFGSEWGRAGEMVLMMVPWLIAQFLSSPLSMALHITASQRSALILQVFGFMLRVGSVWGASIFARDYIVEVYAASGFIFYACYLVVVLVLVRVPLRLAMLALAGGIPIALVCAIAGWTVFWALR
jgi:O-antigen/teichoic acid export membrane protein